MCNGCIDFEIRGNWFVCCIVSFIHRVSRVIKGEYDEKLQLFHLATCAMKASAYAADDS